MHTRYVRLARPAAQTEGNRPNEFCQLVKIPGPLLTPLCKQVPTRLQAKEPIAFRGMGHTSQAARPLRRTTCHEAVAQRVVTQSRERSSLVGRGLSLPSLRGPGQTFPHGGDNLPTLLSQPKLSPAQGYLPWDLHRGFFPRWIHKLLGALLATSDWQTPSHPTSPPSAPSLSLCICAHAILHCQQSSPSSPAAPRPTSSFAAWKEPGEQ